MTTDDKQTIRPVFSCGNCKSCGGRWHLTESCPYQKEPPDKIALTEFNDALLAYPDSDMADDRPLGLCIGVHFICRGFVDLKETSPTHNAIICRQCGLRIIVPKSVESYGHLRQWSMVTLRSK